MPTSKKDYLSAAGKDWLLPFYDLFTRLLGVGAVHNMLLHQSAIESGHKVLEIGCGTGNLTLLAKRLNPDAHFVGLDPDPKALARASRKARRSGSTLKFEQGFSEQLPYPDASIDRVLSAFMLHHVQPDAKLLTIQQAFRVLRPGGSLHLVDFEETHSHEVGSGLHGFLAGKVHARHGSSPQETVLGLMKAAGFEESRQVAQKATIMGRVIFYRAVRPQAPLPNGA